MSDESLRELFRELRDEPIPADSLARVRTSVHRGIAARRKRFFAFGAFATAAMVFLLVFVLTPPRRGVAPPPTPPAPLTAPAILGQPVEQERVRQPARSVARRKKKQPEKPVLIRIETDDPEVVILLVGN